MRNVISHLIETYFNSSLSKGLQLKFQQWLINSGHEQEKEETMRNIWDKDAEIFSLSPMELNLMHQKLNGQSKRSSVVFKKYLLRAAAVVALLAVSAAGTYYCLNQKYSKNEMVECFVPYGEQKHVQLPDGTSAWLNSGSVLIYPKAFLSNKRMIYLNGQASFDVAHDAAKPFIVKSAHLSMQALGTLFDLNDYTDSEWAVATLERGKVLLRTDHPEDKPFILSPNEQISYNSQSRTFVHDDVDAHRLMQWRGNYLVLQNASFDEVVKAIERRYKVTVNYETNQFENRSFTMRFKPNENVNQVMEVLKAMIRDFNYKIDANNITINLK